MDSAFDYEAIVLLYTSGGVLQNKSTFTHYTPAKITRLREDINTLGVNLSQTGSNWTANNFDWTLGTPTDLLTDKLFWSSYITDLRKAIIDLHLTANISTPKAPVFTLMRDTGISGATATISGTALTQPGADFSSVVDNESYCDITSGTGATTGKYLITAHTADTLTLRLYSGDSVAGDVNFSIDSINVVPLYVGGKTATISSGVLTLTGADFGDVTNSSDYCYINKGTGVTPGRYQISAHTTDTLTLSGNSDTSATGDLHFNALLTGNKVSYTDVRYQSLLVDIQTAILGVAGGAGVYDYFVDKVNGNDTTGDGSSTNPYQTWGKVATICNATPGNIYMYPGTYDIDTALTANSVAISTSVIGLVIWEVSILIPFSNITDLVINNMRVDLTGVLRDRLFNNTTDLVVNNTIFYNNGSSSDSAQTVQSTTPNLTYTFNNCDFISNSVTGDGFKTVGSAVLTINLNNCIFYDLDVCINAFNANHTVNTDYCGFNTYNTLKTGSGTHNDTNALSSDPQIRYKSNMYLDDDSPYIDAGSDSKDVGAVQNMYNIIEEAADVLIVAEQPEMSLSESVDDALYVFEELSEVSVSLTTELLLGGLFKADPTGGVEYVTSAVLDAWTWKVDGIVGNNTLSSNVSYDGANIDMSFTNTGGDQFKLYATYDDGSSDYTSLALWETINNFEAGETTGTYFINAFKDCVTGDEWGEGYAFTTETADGVNDQKAAITLKIRAKNMITGAWSELVTVTKEYYFNDFAKTIYYCADNPRTVDNEYANHANYYAQTYHSTTDKYTGPDSVDWSLDPRRFAFNPMFKADIFMNMSWTSTNPGGWTSTPPPFKELELWEPYLRWQDRKRGNDPAGDPWRDKMRTVDFMLYAMVAVNFGNYNDSSDHCFADINNQVWETADPTVTNDIFSQTNNPHYLYNQVTVLETDCVWHMSYVSLLTKFPCGTIVAWDDFYGKHEPINSVDYTFEVGSAAACAPLNRLYFWIANNSGYTFAGLDRANYIQFWCNEEIYVNTDITGSQSNGEVTSKMSSYDDTGTITERW